MKYAVIPVWVLGDGSISPIQAGFPMWRAVVLNWEGLIVLDTLRWSEQGAHIARMQFEQRTRRAS